jgi:hypothetical protein
LELRLPAEAAAASSLIDARGGGSHLDVVDQHMVDSEVLP